MAREAVPGTLHDGARWRLAYTPNEGLRPVTADAELVEYRPGFGGSRWLFVCPECSRRARILYGGRAPGRDVRPHRIACQHCLAICWPSQFESAERRWSRQLAKIEARLGGDPRKIKPPTRRKAWDRLAARHEYYRNKIADRRRGSLQRAMRGRLWPTDPEELEALRGRYGLNLEGSA